MMSANVELFHVSRLNLQALVVRIPPDLWQRNFIGVDAAAC